jgi:tetratricopeptide (TPR) repeat protein
VTTLSVALIVRDEERTLARCLASIRAVADEIVVLDTGSRDGTKEIAARYADTVGDFAWRDDFSAARQAAFDRARGDWVMWLDADDVVVHADRIPALLADAPAHVAGYYWPYVVAWDGAGNPAYRYWRERCVRNDGSFRWEGRVHEVLVARAPGTLVREAGVVVEHRPDPERAASKHGRNLAILQAEYLASGDAPSPRLLFYLAREYMEAGEDAQALAILREYLRVAQWEDEKYLAQRSVAALYRRHGQFPQAIEAELRALAIRPEWPDAYFGLAEIYYHLRDWPKVTHWCEIGRALPPPDTLLFSEPRAYTHNWIIHYTNALYHVGRIEEALAWTMRALASDPADMWHRENREFFTRALAADAAQGAPG